MNSEEPPKNGVTKDSLPSTSQITTPDSNANLTITATESKGAIPKTKPLKTTPKKINNNVDNLKFTNEVLKRNGFITSSSSNYLNNGDSDTENRPVFKESNIPGFEKTVLNIPVENLTLNDQLLNVTSTGLKALNQVATNYCLEDRRASSSSSDDNELLSVSDDGCIYTYKGDHVADLPSSFFNLEIPLLEDPPVNGREENSSPEMDFLEMDFDPGPSGDADSDSISNAEIDNASNLPLDSKQEPKKDPKPCCSKDLNTEIKPTQNNHKQDNTPKIQPPQPMNITKPLPEPRKATLNIPKVEVKMPWWCPPGERTRTSKSLRLIRRHHSPRGDLSSPSDPALNGDTSITNLTSFHNATGKISIDDKNSVSSDIEKCMVWTHHEACLKQITQVGASACGATAVINVLNALRFPNPSLERLQECVRTRLRANSAPLTEYLLSRSNAGCTHRDIIAGLYELSDRQIYSRFFPMFPERLVNLQMWLGYWIKNGAVPIATLNLQKCAGNVPDSWHHQMIFGVGPEGIYLTNPLECVDPEQLWPQLSSESELLVRTDDVVSRWCLKTDIPQMLRIDDVRWRELNVVGQVAKCVRASRREARVDYVLKSHIKIPAEYRAGITLALNMDSPAFTMLRQCPELPLLQPEYDASAL